MTRTIVFPLILLISLAAWPAAGEIKRDIAYGSHASQRLDLSIPAGKKFSTVIFVHGGSLTEGDKADEDYGSVAAPFVKAGMACANVNYRLAPEAAWPAPAEDVAAAVAWVRAHIGGYGGDPHKLFLLGHSSGAMLVAVVGSDEHFLARHKLKPSDLNGVLPMGSIMWDDELQAAMEEYGRDTVEKVFMKDPDNKVYGSLEAYLEHWPIRHVHAGLPPFLFLIAEGEQEQPPVLKTNRRFAEQARALGNRADCKVLPGRTHMSAIRKLGEPGDSTFTIIRDFVVRADTK